MRSSLPWKLSLLCILAGVLLWGAAFSEAAQKVPIDFDRNHGYTFTAQYLKDVARAYPDITKLLQMLLFFLQITWKHGKPLKVKRLNGTHQMQDLLLSPALQILEQNRLLEVVSCM